MSVNEIAIKVSNLGKSYKIYNKPIDMLKEIIMGKKYHVEHWALKDITFEVKKGQVVGVIGSNGAGKSTLLKILAGTLDKTQGEFHISGKISAILELGTGFHPQYTGRENIQMGGMCLGMTKAEIRKKEQWIIDFSELGDAIDQPFQTYSSGMKARLTFATAISVDPEMFIIDEALAAGDAYFVSKCMSRIRQICNSGATVFFVSHSSHLVAELCDYAIWIESGELKAIGDSNKVVKAYEYECWKRVENDIKKKNLELRSISSLDENFYETQSYSDVIASGNYVIGGEDLKIDKVEVLGEHGLTDIFTVDDYFSVQVFWKGKIFTDEKVWIGLGIGSDELPIVTSYESWSDERFLSSTSLNNGFGIIKISIPHLHLGQGEYFISVSLSLYRQPWSKECILHRIDKACYFRVKRRYLIPSSLKYDPVFDFTEVKC